jgi:hypothetical protein
MSEQSPFGTGARRDRSAWHQDFPGNLSLAILERGHKPPEQDVLSFTRSIDHP